MLEEEYIYILEETFPLQIQIEWTLPGGPINSVTYWIKAE